LKWSSPGCGRNIPPLKTLIVKNEKKPAIAFIASLPPPPGGFSVGLQRLLRRLDSHGIDYSVYDLINRKIVRLGGRSNSMGSRPLWLLRYFFLAREDLICCHYSDWRLLVIVGKMNLLGKRTLISIGGRGLSVALEEGSRLRRSIIGFAMRRYACVIAHNEDIRRLCLSLGVRPERIALIPGFIPPTVEADDLAAIPGDIMEFMAGHRPVIAANAFEMVFYRGQDLYGLDLCVDLCARLKQSYPDIGFVFSLSQPGDEEHLRRMERRIARLEIENNFRILMGPYPFYPILLKSQVFIRPTNTDGDANSLREALYFKVPSVASDVIPRPAGTIVFKNRDIDDLTRRVTDLLQNYDDNKRAVEEISVEDNSVKLIELYNRLTGDGAGD
jgi:glycosyltransferase involved in cell wall biosynthesis